MPRTKPAGAYGAQRATGSARPLRQGPVERDKLTATDSSYTRCRWGRQPDVERRIRPQWGKAERGYLTLCPGRKMAGTTGRPWAGRLRRSRTWRMGADTYSLYAPSRRARRTRTPAGAANARVRTSSSRGESLPRRPCQRSPRVPRASHFPQALRRTTTVVNIVRMDIKYVTDKSGTGEKVCFYRWWWMVGDRTMSATSNTEMRHSDGHEL